MADETITDDRTTKDRATDVATTARDEARGVVGDATSEVSAVVSEAGTQGQNLAHEARSVLRRQASDGTSRAAGAVDQLAGRLRALAAGNTDQAGEVCRYAQDIGDRLGGVAGRLNDRGLDGVVDDVQRFARRRPGMFLAVAAGAGFAAGRLFRGARADAESGSSTTSAGNGHETTGTGAAAVGMAGGGPTTALPSAATSDLGDDAGVEPAGPEGGTAPASTPYGGAASEAQGGSR